MRRGTGTIAAVTYPDGVSDVPGIRSQPNPYSFRAATTLVAVIELSLSSWLISGTIPGVERQPLKTIAPDETELHSHAAAHGYLNERPPFLSGITVYG